MVSRILPALKDLLNDKKTSSSKHYESAAAGGGSGESQFFISHIKPHKLVSPSTVWWLVQVLAMAGIDIGELHAHSTRSLLSSLAEVTEISLTDIIKLGNWS